MNSVAIAFAVGIGLSIVTVVADSLIKHASLQKAFSAWPQLVLGALIYFLSAFGWFFVMRKVKLSTLGVLYGVTVVVLLALVSVFYFKERLNAMEIVAIGLAIVSLVILARFA